MGNKDEQFNAKLTACTPIDKKHYECVCCPIQKYLWTHQKVAVENEVLTELLEFWKQ